MTFSFESRTGNWNSGYRLVWVVRAAVPPHRRSIVRGSIWVPRANERCFACIPTQKSFEDHSLRQDMHIGLLRVNKTIAAEARGELHLLCAMSIVSHTLQLCCFAVTFSPSESAHKPIALYHFNPTSSLVPLAKLTASTSFGIWGRFNLRSSLTRSQIIRIGQPTVTVLACNILSTF